MTISETNPAYARPTELSVEDLGPSRERPFANPAAESAVRAATWRLSGRAEPEAIVQEVQISAQPFTIGRRSDNNLCLANMTVSGHHAVLTLVEDRLFVKDLDSTNGTFVNGKRVQVPEALRDGDRVQIGTALFVVRRHYHSVSRETVSTDIDSQALVYMRFDKLISGPAVVPFYQPIVRLNGAKHVGYEVLARSRLVGLETADKMFQVAAELNSEVALSCLMRREGLRHGAAFGSQMPLYLNTHPSEFGKPALLDSLRQLRHEFPQMVIVLEIHEAAITSSVSMTKIRGHLQDLRIGLAYDDFGAGQARLVELADAPPDIIKFDVHMIRGLPEASPERRRMVAALVQMVRTFGAIPLAEGIETAGEATACHDLGFELAQGYFFGIPSPASAWCQQPAPQVPCLVP